jgi:ABC-type sugar transport system substrate-binding protein
MASAKQRSAARRNIKKAAAAAKKKRTIAHLPKFHSNGFRETGEQGGTAKARSLSGYLAPSTKSKNARWTCVSAESSG